MTADAAVREGHRLFRAALIALAYPGWPVPARVADLHALVQATWPETAPVWSADPALLPPGRIAADIADAEILLIAGPTSHGWLRHARRGTEELPEEGATAVYVVDQAPATQVRLSGPGIDGTTTTTLPLTAGELADRAACCAERPLGVDLLVVTGGTLIGLPRTTRVEVVG